MSAINRVPIIDTILEDLSTAQLTALLGCINGEGDAPIFRSLKPIATDKLTAADKGIKPIKLEIQSPVAAQQLYEGYLIYTDDMCVVISYAAEEVQNLFVLDIDPETLACEIKTAALSILELRSTLADELTEEAGAEDPRIPDPTLPGDVGKALVVGEDGTFEYGEAGGGDSTPVIDLGTFVWGESRVFPTIEEFYNDNIELLSQQKVNVIIKYTSSNPGGQQTFKYNCYFSRFSISGDNAYIWGAISTDDLTGRNLSEILEKTTSFQTVLNAALSSFVLPSSNANYNQFLIRNGSGGNAEWGLIAIPTLTYGYMSGGIKLQELIDKGITTSVSDGANYNGAIIIEDGMKGFGWLHYNSYRYGSWSSEYAYFAYGYMHYGKIEGDTEPTVDTVVIDTNNTVQIPLTLPSDASTKTLTLKAVNGTIQWVE